MSTLWRTGIGKAKKCVHCGAILIPEEKKHCTECGAELEEGMTECPNCGCPVEDTLGQETDERPQKVEVTGVKVTKKIKVIIGIIVVLLVAGGATAFGVTQYQKKRRLRNIHNVLKSILII